MIKRRLKSDCWRAGFTLLELILVMLILAIVSAMVVPSIANFAMTRSTDNAVLQIMNLAQYARSQAVSDAKTYRMNFDTRAGEIWLTVDKGSGVFQPPPNDFGSRMTLKDGMKMEVTFVPQGNTKLVMDPNVQPQDVDPKPPFGQPVWPSNNVQMQIAHADGTYIEIQPSGRLDPALLQLTDRYGRQVSIGAATSTEVLHVLKPEEMK